MVKKEKLEEVEILGELIEENKVEEQETKETKEDVEEKKLEIDGDIKFYIKSSVIYEEKQYIALFGKPNLKSSGKTSIGIIRDEIGDIKILIHDFDFGNDVELMRRNLENKRKIPLIPILILGGGLLFLLFMFIKPSGAVANPNPTDTTQSQVEVVQQPIPQEYIEAYNEKMNNANLTNNTIQIIELQDKLNMCEKENIRLNTSLNYANQNNNVTCPNITCEETKKVEYEACIDREKKNDLYIYQGKILEGLCSDKVASGEKCAEIYYNYFLKNLKNGL